MQDSFMGGIMIGAGKATSSRGKGARVAYYFGEGQLGVIETGWFEHR
jgi:hypothetical protein